MTTPLISEVAEILTQVAWYGSYQRSGEEPEGPTLSPEQAAPILLQLLKDKLPKELPQVPQNKLPYINRDYTAGEVNGHNKAIREFRELLGDGNE